MIVAKKIGIVCLVTRVCLTSAILTTKASLNLTNVSRPWHSYLPAANSEFSKHRNYQYDDHHTIGSNLEKLQGSVSRDAETERPMGLQSASTLSNRRQKSQISPQRFPTEIHRDDIWLSAKVPSTSPSPPPSTTITTTTMLSGPRSVREYYHHIPQQFAYQDIQVLDDRYLTEELDNDRSPYHGKIKTYYRRRPQDITAAIKALDRFLSHTLNDDSYNSKVHPPPNPVLALVLSRYGRYVPGPRNPRVYANLAVNNIHNIQPFGKYKYEYDEEPIYPVRR
ncbi:uncharacterized protein LOC105429091 [Pogonomyrmex barbatus]|uniref:Uncharacterized protein LOC105429091 n=1 Tax=Pogonomyrmex barbatus TaxID=144034 RepID=A0A6I9X6N9_9HYME|nr:uncharacterized protein LOC105429091 [Pogonomyrmex barbatus]